MIKIKSGKIRSISWFVVMFFFAGIAAYAQDSTIIQTPTSQWPSPSTQETPSTQESPSTQDLSFNTDASQLSNDLVNQTGLSSDKAAEISQILTEYRNDIAQAKSEFLEKEQNQDNTQSDTNQDVTGGQSRADMTDILGENVEEHYVGATPDLMDDYRDADMKADGKIKDVFENDVQKSRYEQVKDQWWTDVKDKVFSSLTQDAHHQME